MEKNECGIKRSGCKESQRGLKEQLIKEFNELYIEDMHEVTDLNLLSGSFINLKYKMENGQTVQLWDDNKTYYGYQLCKKDSERCYGLVADEKYLLVCEYGNAGSDAEIIIYKKRDVK